MLDRFVRRAVSAPLKIWVVSDGRVGMENQALGLAEAVRRLTPADISVRRIRWRPLFDKLPSALKASWMLDLSSDATEPAAGEVWPDLWIATGRATLPLSARIRQRSAGRTFVVQTQDPRWRNDAYDLIVAPVHDGVAGPNVLSITGSPHRVTAERLAEGAAAFAGALEALPRPRVAVLIGGRSRAFDLTEPHAVELADRIGDGEGPNPYFAFLHFADHVLVTEDSANMAAEAASAGRPVHILPMIPLKSGDKFGRLHADLRARGAARAFDGLLEPWSYTPLAETDRAARVVLDRMTER